MRGFARDRRGATAIEFVMVFPIVLVLTLGVLELGLIYYDYHRAGEAMRMAARSFVIDPPVTSFSSLPMVCPGGANCDSTKMNIVVAAVQNIMPNFAAANLQVTVDDSGVDDATANPGVVTPMLTVGVVGLDYDFFLLDKLLPFVVPDSFEFPPFTTTRLIASQIP